MGKSKPVRGRDVKKARKAARNAAIFSSPSNDSPADLLARAATQLQIGDPEGALPLAQKAEALLQNKPSPAALLPVLSLLGEIYVENGDPEAAVATFQRAVELDPRGEVPETDGGGAEKFFWLAQLSEDGGRASIDGYEKGVAVLERLIAANDGKPDGDKEQEERRKKLASALCSMIEVWMTDLSFEDDAEAQCESLISRAMLVSPTPYVPTLQTLASIRLSQARHEDAQTALRRSLDLWSDLPPEHVDVPDFATRISLARLLMEAEMEERALEVLDRLVGEEDQSVEAWYLGGWCQYIMAEAAEAATDKEQDERKSLRLSSREWLRNCLKLYELLDYDDERLHDHAHELVSELDSELGEAEIEEDDEGEWEDDDDDSDAESDEHAMDTS